MNKNNGNGAFKWCKFVLILFSILGITFALNIFGNWYQCNYHYFNFEIFSSYAPVLVTVIGLYFGYKQYLDQKATEQQKIRDEQFSENTKAIYIRKLDKFKLEEELCYEYYKSMIKFQETIALYKNENTSQIHDTVDKLNYAMYEAGDKLDFLTDIMGFDKIEVCVECDYIEKYFPDVIKSRNSLYKIKLDILDDIESAIASLYSNMPKGSSTSEENIKSTVKALKTFQNDIAKVVNNKVKKTFIREYKIYRSFYESYIEFDYANKFVRSKECEKCEKVITNYEDYQRLYQLDNKGE